MRNFSRATSLFILIFSQLIAICIATVVIARVTFPLRHAKAPLPLPANSLDGFRFGISETVRHEIFNEMAKRDEEHRQKGKEGFPGDHWSSEDHRSAYERNFMRDFAARRGLSLTQLYLILDEGIREKWPGPDGKPLVSTTIPLKPRQR